MTTPAWILDMLAAVMLGVAVVSVARLAAARPGGRGQPGASADIDVAHVLMAIAMAGTLAPGLATLPAAAWAGIFGLVTAWFGYRAWLDSRVNGALALGSGHYAPHLVHGAAMLYMSLAVTAPAASGAAMAALDGPAVPTPALRYPTLAAVFALALIGFAIWDLDQLSGRRYRLASAGAAIGPGVPAAVGVPAAAGLAPAAAGPPPGYAIAASPGIRVGIRVIMGVTMAFILVMML